MCESGGGRPGIPVPNKSTVSVGVKQHFNSITTTNTEEVGREVQIQSYTGIGMRPQWHDLIKSYQGHNA